MPYKEPEKQREADRRWREANPESGHPSWGSNRVGKSSLVERLWNQSTPRTLNASSNPSRGHEMKAIRVHKSGGIFVAVPVSRARARETGTVSRALPIVRAIAAGP
jgi:hypothetical protein